MTHLLLFDHVRHDIKVVSHVNLNGDIEQFLRQGNGQDRRDGQRGCREPLELPPELQSNGQQKFVSSAKLSRIKRTDRYAKMIDRCIDYIYAGDMIQITYSQRFSRSDRGPSVPDLPVAAQHQSVPVYVLLELGRLPDRRGGHRDRGHRPRRPGRHPSDRWDPAQGRDAG